MLDSIRAKEATQYCDIEAFKMCAKNVGGEVEELMNLLEKTNRLTCKYFLPWQDAFCQGGTDYIDGIKPSSVHHSVHWGIDPYRRIFATFHFKTTDINENQTAAVFQRYTKQSLLISAGHYNHSSFFPTGPVNNSRLQQFEVLLSKESIEYPNQYFETPITLTLTSPTN